MCAKNCLFSFSCLTGTIPKAAIPSGFPNPNDPARLIEVPTYHPSAEQFQDPIAYLDSIWRDAEPYGMCRIVPPEGWKVLYSIENFLVNPLAVSFIYIYIYIYVCVCVCMYM